MKSIRALRTLSALRLFAPFLAIAFCIAPVLGVATAGVNDGGALVIHAEPSIVYTTEAAYCDSNTTRACGDLIIDIEPREELVVYLTARFPDNANPRVAGVAFGLDYDAALVSILDYGACGDFELPSEGWPGGATGTAVTWTKPQTDVYIPVYWLVVSAAPGAVTALRVAHHPEQGAHFADDGIPATIDDIACLGSLGFNQAGTLCCTAAEASQSVATPRMLDTIVTPNPATGSSRIRVTAVPTDLVHLTLYSPLGRQMGDAVVLQPGPNGIPLRSLLPPNANAGVYYLITKSPQGQAHTKLILAHTR